MKFIFFLKIYIIKFFYLKYSQTYLKFFKNIINFAFEKILLKM